MPSIDQIEGLGVRSATKLRKAGIRTTESLLKRAASKQGRSSLAAQAGLDEAQVLGWVNRADLMRCKGIGSEYSDLLGAAGVNTVNELRRRNASTLTAKLVALNDAKRMVRRLPTEHMVARWIEQAQEIQPLVSH